MINEVSSPHSLDLETVFNTYQTKEEGLSDDVASQRKQQYGENRLPFAPPKSSWERLLSQFHNVLIYVLIGSALISALLQHYLDSGVIFAVIIVNALLGFIQEGKAEDALRAIMSMTKTQCMVVRCGTLKSIDSADLVPGDIIVLQAGDRVPADIRLFFCKDLRCDESALTGEAQPMGKHTVTLPADTLLAERKNMTYMGTMVTYGLARGVVTKTGLNTQIGEISNLVCEVEMLQTPLQLQLARFTQQLTIGILIVSAIAVFLGIYIHGFDVKEMYQAAIGIAVASIPEGLPAIVTIALAIGVQRMAKNRALVRRLPAVEVLGSVDVICSDKTGTLTANAMTVREVFTSSNSYKVSGEGYRPEGSIEATGPAGKVLFDHDSCFTQASVIAMLCNDANLATERGEWVLHGDPTEGALLALAMKHGLTVQQLSNDWPRIDIIPFESERRYMATLHHNPDGQVKLMLKGAPERLIKYVRYELGENGLLPIEETKWQRAMDEFAKKGMRVMALAFKDYEKKPAVLSHQEVESDLVMVGLVGISDPPRPEAIASIKLCHNAGIRVKMITGDNPVTAAAIGNELGLNAAQVMTGTEIDTLSAEQLAKVVEDVDIFARASPANKLQLVSALQKNQHVVAMTGDGVNDAPALKKANIGVAMGHKGTDAAKEAADFILTDDNFSTIARAVSEGRAVYDNIVKSIIFILPTSLAEALVIFTAIMLGLMMPVTPAQILWVNMITTVTLAIALAFEPAERDIMNKPPRPFGQGLFSPSLVVRMLLVGGLGALIVFSLFYYYRDNGATLDFARTISVNALVMIEMFYLFNCRFLSQSVFSRNFFIGCKPVLSATLGVIVLQVTFTYFPAFQDLFGLESIGFGDWITIVVCTIPVLFIVECEKTIQRMRKNEGILTTKPS